MNTNCCETEIYCGYDTTVSCTIIKLETILKPVFIKTRISGSKYENRLAENMKRVQLNLLANGKSK